MSDMVTIAEGDLVESVADALQFISYYHPMDYIRALGAAYQAEQGPAAKDAIAQILTNSRMCAEGHRPICQDTGIVNVFVEWGQECRLDSALSLQEVVDEGVRRAYNHPENKLRASILADPAFTRRNTRDNTPCVLSVEMVPGRTVSIDVAAKGGGSENKSKFKMMNPSDNIVAWVLEQIPSMGAGWCPPGMLGSASAGPPNIASSSPR
jgi:fumarate hydratase class I